MVMTDDRLQRLAWLTREDIIQRGAYGFIDRACECDILLQDVVLLVPQPACPAWGQYSHAEGSAGRSQIFEGGQLLSSVRRYTARAGGDSGRRAYLRPSWKRTAAKSVPPRFREEQTKRPEVNDR